MPNNDEQMKKAVKDAEAKAKAAMEKLQAGAKLKTDPNKEKKQKALTNLGKVED